MTRIALFLGAGLAVLLMAARAGPSRGDAAGDEKVRIGTYDNRAVAVAFTASKYNPAKEKMAHYEKAKAANDRDKMKDLQAWGERYQRLLYFQGFGHVPVGDLLAPVKEGVAKLAEDKQLAAVAMECDYLAPNVEAVDVTEDIVRLYEPSERTLKMAKDVRTGKPLDLLQLAALPVRD